MEGETLTGAASVVCCGGVRSNDHARTFAPSGVRSSQSAHSKYLPLPWLAATIRRVVQSALAVRMVVDSKRVRGDPRPRETWWYPLAADGGGCPTFRGSVLVGRASSRATCRAAPPSPRPRCRHSFLSGGQDGPTDLAVRRHRLKKWCRRFEKQSMNAPPGRSFQSWSSRTCTPLSWRLVERSSRRFRRVFIRIASLRLSGKKLTTSKLI